MEALTSGGASVVLLAPVLHGHVWVYLPCKYKLIRLMSISRIAQGKPRTCVVVMINVLSGFEGRCAVEYSPSAGVHSEYSSSKVFIVTPLLIIKNRAKKKPCIHHAPWILKVVMMLTMIPKNKAIIVLPRGEHLAWASMSTYNTLVHLPVLFIIL